jgi:peptide deformylase
MKSSSNNSNKDASVSHQEAHTNAPEIVQTGHPTLHSPAAAVDLTKLDSPEIQQVLKDMTFALESQDDGVGLAAPQIGIPLRIFMVAGFIYDRIEYAALKRKAKHDGTEMPDVKTLKKNPHHFFINPMIVKESKEKKWMDGEGCLSVRWLYGKVYRSTRVSLEAYDEKGNVVRKGVSGILAHIFQHEVDHLNGILFTDKAKDIQAYDPEEIKREVTGRKGNLDL